jgi:uncharacterized protein YbjT (DUF2867 family)
VRDKKRFEAEHPHEQLHIIEADFLKPDGLSALPMEIDIAYYLIHSMSSGKDFETMESTTAENFVLYLDETACRQLIYLTGIVNEEELSPHLASRLEVEKILGKSNVPLTALRAGIIVGSGSASFEIIRDLVEKLPVMIAPKWLNTLCQPIAIRNVIEFLKGVMMKENCLNEHFDIGGPQVLTYKEMLLLFAKVRGLKRYIRIVPVMTPKLSSYWLYFITSTSYVLAQHLVQSMKVNVVCRPNNLADELGIKLLPYKSAVELAFEKIEQQMVLSSWKDAFISSNTKLDLLNYIDIPTHGCFTDLKWREIKESPEKVLQNIWSIGGDKGWYYGNHLWRLRGLMDKFAGGVGLRRGRTNPHTIQTGDALDFWRVLIADKKHNRLLLFAEMKLPGEAWLEFRIMK